MFETVAGKPAVSYDWILIEGHDIQWLATYPLSGLPHTRDGAEQ